MYHFAGCVINRTHSFLCDYLTVFMFSDRTEVQLAFLKPQGSNTNYLKLKVMILLIWSKYKVFALNEIKIVQAKKK